MVTDTLEKLRQHVQWHPEAGYAPLIKEAIRALEAALSTGAEPVQTSTRVMRVTDEMVEAAHLYICGLYPYPQSRPETRQMLEEAWKVASPATLAATEKRNVDEVDVTGWGVLEGHAIPMAVARKLADRINLCINSAPPAPSVAVKALEGGDTVELTLRAMAQNYAGGHSWDHLDGEACLLAADELQMLRAGIKRLSDEEELRAETTGDDPFSMIYLSARLAKTEAELDALSKRHERALIAGSATRSALDEEPEPVGQVDASYGKEGMLVAVYKPNSLPVGTKLYASPAALSAQVQDVAGLESNPITLRWWCQQLLDIIENYDITHDSCDEEIAMLNDMRASVDPAAPAAKLEGKP